MTIVVGANRLKKVIAYRIYIQPKALLVKYQIIIKLNTEISKCVTYFITNFNIMVINVVWLWKIYELKYGII